MVGISQRNSLANGEIRVFLFYTSFLNNFSLLVYVDDPELSAIYMVLSLRVSILRS